MTEGDTDNNKRRRCTYTDFKKDYPSALESFERLAEELAGKRVLVFLDYDGKSWHKPGETDCVRFVLSAVTC